MATGRIRYWAAAKAAAGTAEEPYQAETLAVVLRAARDRRPENGRFAQVLASAAYLVAGQPVGRRDPATVALADGDIVEVLPPFAGG